MPDESAHLRDLNLQYLTACVTGDVDWFAHHLADDFFCRRSDGTAVDKPEFLRRTAEGPDLIEFRLLRVRVRLSGETAAIDGTGAFTLRDGGRGISRYTDVYRRIGGEWKVTSAQVARELTGAAPHHAIP